SWLPFHSLVVMTDRQNRPGQKTRSGAPMTAQEAAMDRRERLRRLAMETVDLSKDPYLLRNHLGTYECKLCLTLHTNEGSYLAHTQGKKHQVNLARRAAKEAMVGTPAPIPGEGDGPYGAQGLHKKSVAPRIGRPGYRVTKQRDPMTYQKSLLFEVDYPEIDTKVTTTPLYRIMSCYEQRVEEPDRDYQYLLIAAEPYETISFKIPNLDIDRSPEKLYQHWDPVRKNYMLQLCFNERGEKQLPALAGKSGHFDPIGVRG
ncbi:Splicing factor 3A subunit 2, partial [Perkinsus olseni]